MKAAIKDILPAVRASSVATKVSIFSQLINEDSVKFVDNLVYNARPCADFKDAEKLVPVSNLSYETFKTKVISSTRARMEVFSLLENELLNVTVGDVYTNNENSSLRDGGIENLNIISDTCRFAFSVILEHFLRSPQVVRNEPTVFPALWNSSVAKPFIVQCSRIFCSSNADSFWRYIGIPAAQEST